MQQTKPTSRVTADDEQKWLALGLDESRDQSAVLRSKLPKVILKPTLATVRQQSRTPFHLDEPFTTMGPGRSLPIVCERACDVVAGATQWLWPGRIPAGRVSVLAAEQRHIASRVACDLAARVSKNSPWPGEPRPPEPANGSTTTDAHGAPPDDARHHAQVLFLSSRGELARSVVPELTRAGADLTRILCVSGVLRVPSEDERNCIRHIQLFNNFDSLRDAVAALPGLRLVVLDPVEEFLEGEERERGFCHASAAFGAIEEIARERNIAIIGVAGLCRGAARPGALPPLKHRILRSVARVAWGIVRQRGEPGRYVLAPLTSLADETESWLPLKLDGGSLTWDSAPIPEPAEELGPKRSKESAHQSVDTAETEWLLRELLAEGSRPAVEVVQLAAALGVSEAMLRRVKGDLGVLSERNEFQGQVYWSLPEHSSARTHTARATGDSRAPLANSREIPSGARQENPVPK